MAPKKASILSFDESGEDPEPVQIKTQKTLQPKGNKMIAVIEDVSDSSSSNDCESDRAEVVSCGMQVDGGKTDEGKTENIDKIIKLNNRIYKGDLETINDESFSKNESSRTLGAHSIDKRAILVPSNESEPKEK